MDFSFWAAGMDLIGLVIDDEDPQTPSRSESACKANRKCQPAARHLRLEFALRIGLLRLALGNRRSA